MDLKTFLPSKKEKDLFWALVIEPGWVQSGIWKVEEEKVDMVSVSPATFWETDEELLNSTDTALSAAAQNLPQDFEEPTKTVFGVSAGWVERGQIKEEFLQKIKKICSELSLEPAGFVVLPEALAHLYKSKEEAALNAIVVGVVKDNIEVSVFKLGNLEGTSQVARSVSIVDDLMEGLVRFDIKDFIPLRILIYDGKGGELEGIRQMLLEYSWEDNTKVKFLHTPRVDIVDPDEKVIATALAGASEMCNASSIFVKDGERKINEVEEYEAKDIENVKTPQENVSAEDLGFLVNEDVGQKPQPRMEVVEQEKNINEEVGTETPFAQKESIRKSPFSFLNELKNKIVKERIPVKDRKRSLVILAVMFVLLLISGVIFLWFFPKATVTIYVSPKKIEEEISFKVDPNLTSSSISEALLTGKILEEKAQGEKTKSTTGVKLVGEKAKGTVRIQNGTSSIINLSAGTILSASNDLKYSLSASASVSAALSPSSPGTASVEVNASSIGAEYNIAKDEILKVSNYPRSDVDAVSTSDFSGGSSKEISAVSSQDLEDLEKDLEEELVDEAKSKLREKLNDDSLFIEDSVSASAESKTFSKKVDDEADSLKLNLDLVVKGVAVKNNDLFDLAKDKLKAKIPNGYVFRQDQLVLNFGNFDLDKDLYSFDVSFSANLLPEIRTDEIAKRIAGRGTVQAENYLSTVPGFSRAEIKSKPKLPSFLRTLPRVVKNITVEISAER